MSYPPNRRCEHIVLSLGAGVQSSTLALMATAGEIEPMPECAIFADTGWEPKAVYEWLEWLEPRLAFPVVRVSSGNIYEDTLSHRLPRASGGEFVTMPLYSTWNGKARIGRRQCTNEYKLRPIRRWIRENASPCRLLIGITTDEAHRMKDSGVRYIRNEYPLIDRRMSRHDCLRWMERQGHPKPPKSSCIACPFKGNAQWRALRDAGGEEWEQAVRLDASIRTVPRLKGEQFLHRLLVPLDQVDLSTAEDHGQQNLFGNECSGMCGV